MSVYYLLNTAIVLTRYIYLFSGLQTIMWVGQGRSAFLVSLKTSTYACTHALAHSQYITAMERE